MLTRDIVSAVNTTVDKVQIVNFNVSTANIVAVVVLLLGSNVWVDVVEGAVRMHPVLVQIVCTPISHSLANWQLIIVLLELVIVAAVDVA